MKSVLYRKRYFLNNCERVEININRGTIAISCALLFAILIIPFTCSWAKTEAISNEHAIKLPKSDKYNEGVPVYKSAVEIRFSKPGEPYFVEVVDDIEYQKLKDKRLFRRGKYYPEVNYPLTKQNLQQCHKRSFILPYDDLKKDRETKYWIRAVTFAVPWDVDQMSEPSGLDRLLKALVQRPIDAVTIGRIEYPYLNSRNHNIYVEVKFGPYYPLCIK